MFVHKVGGGDAITVRGLSEKDAEDTMTKVIRSWSLMDRTLEDEQQQMEAKQGEEHVGQVELRPGDRVYLHSTLWNHVKECFRMWEVAFKDRVVDFYLCVGWVVSCESSFQCTVRFYVRSMEADQTMGIDFPCPTFLLRKAPQTVKFMQYDYVVVVNEAEGSASTYVVVERMGNCAQRLLLENVLDKSRVRADQDQSLLLPVYNTKQPWIVEQRLPAEWLAIDRDQPLIRVEDPPQTPGKRRMYHLVFGTRGEKLNPQAAHATLAHLNNTRDSFLFAQACTRDEDFVNSAINDKVPLAVAIEMGSPFLINVLIACGADKNVRDRRGNTLLHLAAQKESLCVVQTLLLHIPDAINTPNIYADTPFHLACKQRNARLIGRLLQMSEVDKTFRDQLGDTGFHSLIRMEENDPRRVDCLQLFMRSGPWLSATSSEGMVPLQAAISWGKEEAVNLFLDNMSCGDRPIGTSNDDMSLAQTAAKAGNYNIFYRIAQSCDSNFMVTSTRKSVMHFAVEAWTGVEAEDYQRCRVVQLLLARNDAVRLNQADSFENTAVHLLARCVNEMDKAQPFEERLLKKMVANKNGGLMSMINVSEGKYPLATLCFFSTCGADFCHRNDAGMTPLDMLERDPLRVLMADCARAGVNSWTQETVTRPRVVPEFRPCFRCKHRMDPKNVVYCLPCQHYFACAACKDSVTRMDRCMVCSSEVQSIRVMHDGMDDLLHGDVEPQCTEDGRRVSDVIQELRTQIAALEDSIMCEICMEEQCKVVFDCGHTACRNCASENVLKTCHMCRQTITKRVTIF